MNQNQQSNKAKFYYLLMFPIAITLTWLIGETALLVDQVRKTISKVSPEIISGTNHTKSVIEKLDNFINTERLSYIDQATRSQIKSTDEATKGATRLTVATVNTLEQHIQPAIDELRTEAKETLTTLKQEVNELKSLTQTTTEQIQQNGEQVKALLERGEIILAKSEPELLATLAKLKESSQALEILTNDPAVAKILHNIRDGTYHVSLISKDLQQLTHKTIEPIINPKPPKNSFDKYFIRPTIKVFKIVNGAGNVLFLIDRLNP